MLAALAAGCAPRHGGTGETAARPASGGHRGSAATLPPGNLAGLPVAVDGLVASVPGLLAAYNRGHPASPGVVSDAGAPLRERLNPYVVASWAAGAGPPGPGGSVGLVPLTTFLRAANVDLTDFLPGTAEPFRAGGIPYALPITLEPWGLRWREDVFAAAGVGPPEAGDTLADLMDRCALLQGAVREGKAAGALSVFGPMVGQAEVRNPAGQVLATYGGALWYPAVWAAFAEGFGGGVFQDGSFRLTAAPTLAAFGALVELARTYALPPDGLPATPAGYAALPGTYAMEFGVYGGLPAPAGGSVPVPVYSQPWRWTRFPRLPARAVVPVELEGQGVRFPSAGPLAANVAGGPGAAGPALQAAVDVLLWLFQPAQRALMAEYGLWVPAGTPRTVDAYWAARPDGAAAVGDWRSFYVYDAAWPPLNFSPVAQAFARAAAAPAGADLAAFFAPAESALNLQVEKL